MRGVVFEEKGHAAVRSDLERPLCGEDQLLIRTLWSGITNGTERSFLTGGSYCTGFPNRFGYQIVGEIVEKGARVKGYEIGDIVFSGHVLSHSEYTGVPVTEDNLVVKLESGIRPEEAALFGVASVSMHDCRRAQVNMGDRVLIVGLGLVGQFAVQISQARGAVVTASELNPTRLQIARELGCENCIDPTTGSGKKMLDEFGPYDVILENSGADVLPQLIELVRHRGTIVLVAGRWEVVYPFVAAQLREVTILHASHFIKDDIRQVMRLTQKGIVQIKPLIKDILKIELAEGVYKTLAENPARLLGTVFDWR